MKKFKMFLAGLAIITCSNFAFAIEKNLKNQEEININLNEEEEEECEEEEQEEEYEEEEEKKKGMFINGNTIENFSLTEYEKEQLLDFFRNKNRINIKKDRIEEILRLQIENIELQPQSKNPLEIEDVNTFMSLNIVKFEPDGKFKTSYRKFLGLDIIINELNCLFRLTNANGNTITLQKSLIEKNFFKPVPELKIITKKLKKEKQNEKI